MVVVVVVLLYEQLWHTSMTDYSFTGGGGGGGWPLGNGGAKGYGGGLTWAYQALTAIMLVSALVMEALAEKLALAKQAI